MRHPLTTTLTLLLVAQQRHADRFEDSVADVIEHLVDLSGWPDEKKADLYALLVESVTDDMKLAQVEKAVAAALDTNHKRFPNG